MSENINTLKQYLKDNKDFRKIQVDVLHLSEELFGKNSSLYKICLNDVKNTQSKINKIINSINNIKLNK